jgi:hypothetical protein
VTRNKTKTVAMLIACLSGSCGAPDRPPPRNPAAETDVLLRTLSPEGFEGLPMEIVVWLAQRHRLPISFIENDGDRKTGLFYREVTIAKVLDMIVVENPSYRWRSVEGRILLYPRDEKYDTRVGGIDVRDLKRPEAANRLFEALRENTPGFSDWAGAVVLGFADAPIYTEHVSLRPEARVINHLAQLLGDDPNVYFIIHKSKNLRVISFGRVESE